MKVHSDFSNFYFYFCHSHVHIKAGAFSSSTRPGASNRLRRLSGRGAMEQTRINVSFTGARAHVHPAATRRDGGAGESWVAEGRVEIWRGIELGGVR